VVNLELRSLKDSSFLFDDLILMIDDTLFGTDEVILICCGLRCLDWVLLLLVLSIYLWITTTGVSRVNFLLLDRLNVEFIHISQITSILIYYHLGLAFLSIESLAAVKANLWESSKF
jgi:hypothetical protein